MVHPRLQRRALTLTEVIVVVAILAVLIAILLPTLVRARETSRRAACMNNIRQLAQVYRLYSAENYDAAPLGYSGSNKQFNYMVNVNDDRSSASGSNWLQYYTHQGILYKGGYLTGTNDIRLSSGRAFFCPSAINPRILFNGQDTSPVWPDSKMNPWPPIETKFFKGSQWLKASTRVAYGTRPDTFMWPDQNTAGQNQIAYPTVAGVVTMAKLTANYSSKAILSDIVSTYKWVDEAHNEGVNVLYGDFSIRWVPRKKFNAYLPPDVAYVNTYNPNMDNIFLAFDKER